MRAAVLALVAAIWAPAAHAQPTPDWIVGHWLSCADGRATREAWTGAGTGLLAGVNVTAGRRTQFEFMRIAPQGDTLAFFGSPNGAPPVAFAMVSHANRRAVFENPAHDFPQRVIYARAGRDLVARVEGVVDGKLEGQAWRFRPARADAQCR